MVMRWFDAQRCATLTGGLRGASRPRRRVHAATISDRAPGRPRAQIEEFASLMGNAENFRRLAELEQEFHQCSLRNPQPFMIEINDASKSR
jgi:hypothetical protein